MVALDVGAEWIDLASLLIAITAVGLSIFSAWKLAIAEARRQFADLESMFFQVFQSLPEDVQSRSWDSYSPRQQNAAELYWNLAYLEWKASKASRSNALKRQWEDYYRHVQVSGFKHPGLTRGLEQRLRNDPALLRAWRKYLSDLQAALKEHEESEAPGFFETTDHEFDFLRSRLLLGSPGSIDSDEQPMCK